jgi:AcrR family transcriptional regulator
MSLKERQWKLREHAILDAAYEVLTERGGTGASMDEIAARAGVSKPTLYQHFASKDDLVLSVSMHLMQESEAAAAAREPGTSALDHLARTLVARLARRAGLWTAHVTVRPELVEASPAYQAQQEANRARWARLVDEAKAEGDLDPCYPTPVVVRMLMRLFRADYEDLLEAGVVTVEELCGMLVAVTIRGLRPPGAPDWELEQLVGAGVGVGSNGRQERA